MPINFRSSLLTRALLTVLFLTSLAGNVVLAQKNKKPVADVPLIKQTISRHEAQRLGFGGTVSIVGAPQGSITIEGWDRSQVDVSAEIELQAPNEEDLKLIAKLNTFVFDSDLNHIRILTTGTHDRAFMKRAAKDFPKRLLGLPWKVDYKIRVPAATDLEVDAGRGPLKLLGVEGALKLSASESETTLQLIGGTVSATIAVGKVTLSIPARSWRGAGADIRVAAGSLTIELPAGFNGDIDASVLRTGSIEDQFGGLEPREKPGITPRQIRARAGAGGAFFNFTIGDGVLYLRRSGG